VRVILRGLCARVAAAGHQTDRTPNRGIGPTQGDEVARTGIRVQDLLDPGIWSRS